MSPGNLFLGDQKVKGQGHDAQKLPVWVFALLRVPVAVTVQSIPFERSAPGMSLPHY